MNNEKSNGKAKLGVVGMGNRFAGNDLQKALQQAENGQLPILGNKSFEDKVGEAEQVLGNTFSHFIIIGADEETGRLVTLAGGDPDGCASMVGEALAQEDIRRVLLSGFDVAIDDAGGDGEDGT